MDVQDRATSMRRQLDYILVRRKWRKSILNESYSTFDSVGSDHRVVAAQAAPEPEGPQERPEGPPDWEAFAGSPELQANYTAEVRGRLHLLAEGGEPTTYGGSSPPAKRQPGNGYRRRGDIEPPLGPNTQRLCERTRVEEARRSFVREGTAESQEELNGAKQQLFSTYDRIKGEELMEKVKKVETVHGERRYKESWKVINEMSGRKRSRRDSWQAAAQRRG
ncbi:hypothetical protein AAFF_G00335930 [Aldrovandia affinis]|uniref:Uncharacterized protein n=1 Tax=Aldrovandia affinis TaxID=143900 RepID=A0AAD7WPZ5_9TELE|nr:hypothetical protein AAFF_G00335930 [Aldrovandia affinis]